MVCCIALLPIICGRKKLYKSNSIKILAIILVLILMSANIVFTLLEHNEKKDLQSKIGQQLSYLANFYQTREGSPEGYDEATTKVHIIGSNETVTAINEFNDNMNEAFLELIPQKEEINFLEQSLSLLSTTNLKESLIEDKNLIGKDLRALGVASGFGVTVALLFVFI